MRPLRDRKFVYIHKRIKELTIEYDTVEFKLDKESTPLGKLFDNHPDLEFKSGKPTLQNYISDKLCKEFDIDVETFDNFLKKYSLEDLITMNLDEAAREFKEYYTAYPPQLFSKEQQNDYFQLATELEKELLINNKKVTDLNKKRVAEIIFDDFTTKKIKNKNLETILLTIPREQLNDFSPGTPLANALNLSSLLFKPQNLIKKEEETDKLNVDKPGP